MKNYHPPQVSLSEGPYRSTGDHLRDELARIDLLVRAQLIRWRLTIGASKPENLWGMVHVSDEEIDSYLAAEVWHPGRLPESLFQILRPIWDAAGEVARRIRMAVESTPSDVELRLESVCSIFGLSYLERDILLLCLFPETDFRYRRLFGYLQDDASRTRPPTELLLQILEPYVESLEAAREVFEPGRVLLSKHLVVLGPIDETRPMRSVRVDDRIGSWLLGLDAPDERLQGILSDVQTQIGWDQLFFDDGLHQRLRDLAAYGAGVDTDCHNTDDSVAGPNTGHRPGRWWPFAGRHHVERRDSLQERTQGCATNRRSRSSNRPITLLFHGPYGSGRWKAAQAICTATHTRLLRVSVQAALRDAPRWELTVDLSYREASLQNAALYWDGVELLFQDEQSAFRWDYLLQAATEFHGLTFLAVTSPSEASALFRDSHLLRVDFPVPSYDLRKKMWVAYLPDTDSPSTKAAIAETLAASFQLTEGQILEAVAAARTLAQRRDVAAPRINREDLYEACRRQSGKRLVAFARRIEPRRNLQLDDVVLPESNRRQLAELRNRITLHARVFAEMGFDQMTLGKGLLTLFVGPPGTGKTMSAELLASQQRVDLYKVDASAVVSKWVGETEKNLGRIFSEAENSNAMLFFDECDALFGQRGEIKDAKDRWANLEVNYLLQRVEEYSGVVIMATNLRQNIDDAFLRRIQVVVEFPSPDANLRFRIWKSSLPPAPLSEVTDDQLRGVAEKFTLSGGDIRNTVIDATFRAFAGDPHVIGIRHLVVSTAREYQKLGRPITRGDFGELFFSWVVADILAPSSPA